jgi:hypothetical protein
MIVPGEIPIKTGIARNVVFPKDYQPADMPAIRSFYP